MSSNDKVKLKIQGDENLFTREEATQVLDGLLDRTESNFRNGKCDVEAHEDLKWVMAQTSNGISFELCCEALNKDPAEERFRLLTIYMQKHGNDAHKKGH